MRKRRGGEAEGDAGAAKRRRAEEQTVAGCLLHALFPRVQELTSCSEGPSPPGPPRTLAFSGRRERAATAAGAREEPLIDRQGAAEEEEEVEETQSAAGISAFSVCRVREARGSAAGAREELPPGRQAAAEEDEEEVERQRRRVERRMREVEERMRRARDRPCPLGEALCEAAEEGRLEEVRRLLDSGANVNYTDAEGDTPLLRALFPTPRVRTVQLLLDAGAEADGVSREGASALHLAAYDRSGRCVRLLAAAAPDARKPSGSTPLHYAADVGNAAALRELLAAGADARLAAWEGVWRRRRPLDVAREGDARRLLLSHLAR